MSSTDPSVPGSSPSTVDPDSSSDQQVVEQFLDEVGLETQPKPVMGLEGLRGKVALVSGGSSGIGRAICISLARHGVHIGFNYLDSGPTVREDARTTLASLRELEVRCFCRPCDVGNSTQVNDWVGQALDKLGGVHILVNNAGIGRDRALWHMSDEEWNSVMSTNLNGAFFMTRAVSPHLRAQEWGKVVNITSVHGLRSEFGLANYATSKAGLIGLTRSTAIELGPKNVNVNAVAPGYIRTTRLTDSVPAEILDRARERSVLGRLGDPQDVASVVLFLCSEAARHITGATLPVDGGYLL
jgi:3-oxoacyl-[acyl-carrier protein] reductase